MPTEGQLQRHVSTIRRKRLAAGAEDPMVIGFQLQDTWSGPAQLPVDDVTYAVKIARSGLEAREALTQARIAGQRLLLLTRLAPADLGADVMARLTKAKLETLHVVDMVREHFQVAEIDPRIRAERWMLNELLAGPASTPPMAFLDLETAWRCLLAHRLRLDEGRPDVVDLLRWTLSEANLKAWADASQSFREAATSWTAQSAGRLGTAILCMVDKGAGGNAVSVGLCLDAVNGAPAELDAEKREAYVRLEHVANGEPLGPGREQWGEAARQLADDIDPAALQHVLARAEDVAKSCFVDRFARYSRIMPSGLQQVLGDMAALLKAIVDNQDAAKLPGLESLMEAAAKHHDILHAPLRLRRFQKVVELARWLSQPRPAASRLEDWASWYVQHGSLVDLARKWCAYPDAHEPWSRAVASLQQAATARREEINDAFAKAMADRLDQFTPADPLILLEDVMPRVVVPLAEQTPVLMVVMDGMDQVSFQEFRSSLTSRWREAASPWPWPIPLCPLPSVTEVCRTSLICGRLTKGSAADERQSVDYLRIKGKRPAIFHKDGLVAGGGLAPALRDALSSSSCRLVIVVINAVDDWLAKGDQAFVEWSVDAIPVLQSLLELAHLQGRTLVLASDHGHVLERVSRYISGSGAERYRQPSIDLHEGELKVKGGRVVDGPCVVAARENLRYTQGKRNGYHGGLTPQEVLPILAVFSPAAQ